MIILNLNKNSDSTASSGVISRNAVAVKATTIETGSISSYVAARVRLEKLIKRRYSLILR